MTEQHHFPCETCGSAMAFDPGQDRLVCPACGNAEAIDDGGPWNRGGLRELDFEAAAAGALAAAEEEETRVLQCPNCGAQVEFEPATHAAECPFCATPVVTGTGTHRHIRPGAVLPFALTEAEARTALTDWLGRLWFAPDGLQRYARKGRRMEGIYVPYWTFDARTRTAYRGQRGTVHYRTRTVSRVVDGKRVRRPERVSETRWTRVSGRVARDFDDVLVLASHSLPKAHTDALEPWDLAGLVPYRPDYLAGFRAEAYQIPLAEAFPQARARMDEMIRRDIRFDIGGHKQRIDEVETEVDGVSFKHVLLPIWVAAYRYRGESYRFVVNARTGTVRGERPWSAWKIAVAVVLALLVAAVAGYFIAQG